jgi:hypothetical protein
MYVGGGSAPPQPIQKSRPVSGRLFVFGDSKVAVGL